MRFCLSDKNTIAFINGISSFIIPRPKQKKQEGNAGNARENVIFPADFLPGACLPDKGLEVHC